MRQATRGRIRKPGALDDMPSGISPGSLANLQLWFDASTIKNLADGAAVAQWDDLSGNDRHLAQATGGNQPIWKAKSFNGLPCIRLDGSNDYMNCTAFSFTNLTLFIVVRINNFIGDNLGLMTFFTTGGNDYNSVDGMVITTGTPDYDIQNLRYLGGSGNPQIDIANQLYLTPFILTLRWDNSGGNAYMHINGGSDTSDSLGGYLDSVDPNTIRVGARGSSAASYARNDYAEIIAYSDLKDAPTIAAIEAYLTAKWRIG